jgi:hypothetical protein
VPGLTIAASGSAGRERFPVAESAAVRTFGLQMSARCRNGLGHSNVSFTLTRYGGPFEDGPIVPSLDLMPCWLARDDPTARLPPSPSRNSTAPSTLPTGRRGMARRPWVGRRSRAREWFSSTRRAARRHCRHRWWAPTAICGSSCRARALSIAVGAANGRRGELGVAQHHFRGDVEVGTGSLKD